VAVEPLQLQVQNQQAVTGGQGWARDVKAWDRDAHLPRRDRDVGFTSRDETEKRH